MVTTAMDCVVCFQAIGVGQEQYANAWEKTRKRFPCCSAACAGRFDPDVHWIPTVMPVVAVGDEQVQLRKLAFERLRKLDEAGPVVRELLLVGIDPATLRGLVAQSDTQTHERKRAWMVSFLVGLFVRRRISMKVNRDQRSRQSYASAVADLDRWEAVVAARAAIA